MSAEVEDTIDGDAAQGECICEFSIANGRQSYVIAEPLSQNAHSKLAS